MNIRPIATLLAGVILSTSAAARLAQYTENTSSEDQVALGFPVPQPVDSSTPLAGFRSYDSLINTLSLQALQSADFSQQQVGSSLNNRPIYAFRFGRSEQAVMLQVGGMHAREWASPEAVTHIAERLLTAADDDGLETYLRDQASIILVPVLNPDGFISTQTQPERTRIGEDPDDNRDPSSSPSKDLTPRDGRMRRKNLRNSDGQLDSSEDTLQGVDLNRNIGPFWSSSSRSSANPDSIVYHGVAESSEPETLALRAASNWLPQEHLRLFIDTHSYGRVYFYNRSGNERLFNITRDLANLIRVVPPRAYSALQEATGVGIGASDEFFAYQRQVPSYTLEIEPGNSQTAEYGGNAGVSHSGFILPEAEVPRMRNEIYAMARLAYYHQMGAAILQAVQVTTVPSGQVVFTASWQNDGSSRTLQSTQAAALQTGQRYRLQLDFSKPMRWRDAQNRIVAYPGQAAPTAPQLTLQSNRQTATLDSAAGQWLDNRYQADRYTLDFELPSQLGGRTNLQVAVRDLAGLALDSNPETVLGWADGAWSGLEDEQGMAGDRGGEDHNISLDIAGEETAPSAGGGSGGLTLWILLSLVLLRSRLRR